MRKSRGCLGLGGVALGLVGAFVPGGAFGYALNAHVAICQHALDALKTPRAVAKGGAPDLTPASANVHDNGSPDPKKGVVGGKAASGSVATATPNAEIARIVLANPAEFRAGCGAPDAFPFFGNTDPSHSYGWDPVGIAETLLKNARSDAEKSWVYGYFAHLAMDGSVHAFANTYAGMSMKRHGKLKGTLRPQVWDTFEPTNFLAHVAAETWLNRFFVYAADPKDYALATPKEFAGRMFLGRGSPIVRHISGVLERWQPANRAKLGAKYDLQTDISGERPGVLGTYFHRGLEHLHRFEDLHVESMYRWRGHRDFYEKKDGPGDRFKYYLSATFHAWHEGRVKKIRTLLKQWLDTTVRLQEVVSARGSVKDLVKALLPLHKAVSDYMAIGLVDALRLPPPYQNALDTVRGIMKGISEIVRKIIVEAARSAIQPFLAQIEELGKVAMGEFLDRFMDRKARDHARKLLGAAGLVTSASASEPMSPPATRAGIGGASAAEKRANREKLLRYPFYKNAFMSVFAVLSDPKSVRNLSSADFTNAARCADFFRKTRRGEAQHTAVLKGSDALYNATTETCHTPTLTRLQDQTFKEVDVDAKHRHLATASKGFLELDAVTAMFDRLIGAVKASGKWLWSKLGPLLPDSVKGALSTIGGALVAVGGMVAAIVGGGTGSLGDRVKAFVLRLINGVLPRINVCVPDHEINKALKLRPIRTCDLVESLLEEKCTAPFLNTIFDAALPLRAEPAQMDVIEQQGARDALKGIRLGLEKVHVVIPKSDVHRPTIEVEVSLSKKGHQSALRFRTKLAAKIESTCNKRESAFRIRPSIEDIGVSATGFPTWLLGSLGKLALETVKFKGWKPELNRWWKSDKPKPAAGEKPAKPATPCTLQVGGAQ